MTCPSCNQSITPLHVGTVAYCPNCRQPIDTRNAGVPVLPVTPPSASQVHLRTLANGTQVLDHNFMHAHGRIQTINARANVRGTLAAAEPIATHHEQIPAAVAPTQPAEQKYRIERFEDRFKQRGLGHNADSLTPNAHPGIRFTSLGTTPAAPIAPPPAHHATIPAVPRLPRMTGAGASHRTVSQFMHPHITGAANLHRRGTIGPHR